MKFKLVLGSSILFAILLFVFVTPYVYQKNPNSVNLTAVEKSPSKENPLGTDETGRDVLARLMVGGKVSITVGVVTSIVKLFISLILGFTAGFFKKIDSIIMRLCDIFMCFPFYVLAISFSAFVGPSLKNLIILISFFTFAPSTRLIRTEIKTLKDKEFIQILKINGEKNFKILINHIIPNLKNTILVIFTTSVATGILMESSLSFFGLGVKEPMSSWGSMLSVALNVLNIQKKWWMWLSAGVLVLTLVFSINLIGEGLSDDRGK